MRSPLNKEAVGGQTSGAITYVPLNAAFHIRPVAGVLRSEWVGRE